MAILLITNDRGLIAPAAYFGLLPERKAAITNGAGPKWFGWLIPDTIYGLSITEAADIHDYCYWSAMPRKQADALFRTNMETITNKIGGWLMYPRLARVWTYYHMVDKFGRFFYNSPEDK